MRFNGKAVMSSIVVALSVGVFVTALQWPKTTALFPLVTSIALFFLAVAELFIALSGKDEIIKTGAAADFTFSENVNPSLADRRALETFLWIIGFFLLIWFFGFNIAIPLLVFSHLKFYSRESWGISLMLAGLTWVFFFTLFIWLLHTSMPEGLLLEALRKYLMG